MRISDWSSDVCSSDLQRPEKGLCVLSQAQAAVKKEGYDDRGQRNLRGRNDPGKAEPALVILRLQRKCSEAYRADHQQQRDAEASGIGHSLALQAGFGLTVEPTGTKERKKDRSEEKQ